MEQKPWYKTGGQIYKHFVSKFPAPKQGDLKVWWIPQVPGKMFEWVVADLDQAALLLDALAAYDDFQYAENIKGDYANAGGLMVYKEYDEGPGEWLDWESEGDDFDTWRRRQLEGMNI